VRERLLGGTLELHGVDVEHVASKELRRTLHKLGGFLDEHEREDALAYVISEVWRASLDFDPARGSFDARANFVASRRLADWFRKRHGRSRWVWSSHTYERERPALVSLELPVGNSPSGERVRLGDTLGEVGGDPAADRSPDVSRLLGGRDRQRARDLETLGFDTARRVA
jgi:hypothetical protein